MVLTPVERYRLEKIADERDGLHACFMPTPTRSLLEKGLIQITGRVEVDGRVKFAGTAKVTEEGKAALRNLPC